MNRDRMFSPSRTSAQIRESMIKFANQVGDGKLSRCPEFVNAVSDLYSKEILQLIAKVNGLPFSKTKPELVAMLLEHSRCPMTEEEVNTLSLNAERAGREGDL